MDLNQLFVKRIDNVFVNLKSNACLDDIMFSFKQKMLACKLIFSKIHGKYIERILHHMIMSTHWSRDKMAAISQTTLSNEFSLMKFVPKGPINNFPVLVQIMAWRLPASHYLNQWWLDYLYIYIYTYIYTYIFKYINRQYIKLCWLMVVW